MPRRIDETRQCKYSTAQGERCGKFLGHSSAHDPNATTELPIHSARARAQRARHAARLFKQGIRWFRLAGPTGDSFNVMYLDAAEGRALGCKRKRKTILQVKLYDLWPEIRV